MVFNIKLFVDNNYEILVVVVNKVGDKGVLIQFDMWQLFVLILWKNIDMFKQGYVMGIELGISYVYFVIIECEQKCVKQL